VITSGAAQVVRPFPPVQQRDWINPSIGTSTYHGGFVRAEKRMSGSVAFLAHYTFSKFLDDVEASQEFGSTAVTWTHTIGAGQGARGTTCRRGWW